MPTRLGIEERLRLALTAARMVAWEFDPATERMAVLENAADVFGLRPGETVTTAGDVFSLIHPADAPGHRERSAEVARNGGRYRTQFRMVRRDNGATQWMEEQARAVVEADGGMRIVGVVRDITREKEASDALEETLRRKDEFLAMLAHELRNPLSPIVSGVHLIEKTHPSDPVVQRALARMHRQASTLIRIVDDLLDISRITRGKILLQRQPVSIARVIEQAVDTVEQLVASREQHLHVEIARDVRLSADPARLQQVIGNLLNNASKYGRRNGNVWLACTTEGDDLVVRVRDDGLGIAPELLDHVFDIFVQGTPSSQSPGLGLGLTLVRSLVRLHGGSVVARSQGPGQGAEVEVRLPIAEVAADDAVPPETPRRERATPAGGLRVLVIDDNIDHAENLASLLRLDGNQVRVVDNGADGVQSVSDWNPDCVLLDIGMPEVDGFEVMRRMARQHSPSRPFVVAVTGYGQSTDRERTAAAGFDAHLVKPVRYDQLHRVLSGVAPQALVAS